MKGVTLVLSLFIVACAYFFFRPSLHPPAQAIRGDLILREGRLYRTNSSETFSGLMLERYSNGRLRSRSLVKDGLLNGLSEGFYTNAGIQVAEHFLRGISDGFRTKWYSDGGKMSEAYIVQGKLTGIFRRWHENGALAEEVLMDNGEPHGHSVSYYPSGYIKVEAQLDHGKVTQNKFWRDGEGAQWSPNSAKPQ